MTIKTLLALIIIFGLSSIFGLATAIEKNEKKSIPLKEIKDEDFYWLEETTSARALQWVDEQNKKTQQKLTKDPRFTIIKNQATEMLKEAKSSQKIQSRFTIVGNHVLNFYADTDSPRGVLRRAELKSILSGSPEWKIFLDLGTLSKSEGKNWTHHFFTGRLEEFVCLAPDYSRCLIRFSVAGGEEVAIREFDFETNAFVEDGFTLMQPSKTDIAWVDKDTVLVSPAFDKNEITVAGYGRTVRLWKRGTPLSESRLIFDGKQTDFSVYPFTISRPEGNYHFIARLLGTQGLETWHVAPEGKLTKLPFSAEIIGWRGILAVLKGRVIVHLHSPWEAEGKEYKAGTVISVELEDICDGGELKSVQVVLPYADNRAVDELVGKVYASRDSLFISVLEDANGKIMRARPEKDGWEVDEIALSGHFSVGIIAGSVERDLAFLAYEKYLSPRTLYYVEGDLRLKKIKSELETFNSSPFITEQFFATSKDGTQIPYFLVRSKKLLYNRNNPILYNAYGGAGRTQPRMYLGKPGLYLLRALLDKGCVLVFGGIRGGGEYGPRWHRSVLMKNKHKTWEDFFAIAEDLIDKKITVPRRLAIKGASWGGLLMGVAFTQRPDLFNAAISEVPVLDLMRLAKFPYGAALFQEIGDPEDPEMMDYIRSYSPFHNVHPGKKYPDPFFITSTTDARAHPSHARKMAAKMEALGQNIYFYESREGGHGFGDVFGQAHVAALEYVYLMHRIFD